MPFYSRDPRPAWWAFCATPEPTREQIDAVLQLPAGARQAPLDWIFDLEITTRSHFDRDAGEEVQTQYKRLRGWKNPPDPRARYAGELSILWVDEMDLGVLPSWPGTAALGGGLRALCIDAKHLNGRTAEALGRNSQWESLSVWGGSFWHPNAMKPTIEVLARDWTYLRGLELNNVALDAASIETLAGASYWPSIEDLHLRHRDIGDANLQRLLTPIQQIVHLDLSQVGVGAETLQVLGPKVRNAKRLVLSGNPIGDNGVAQLLEAGELPLLEDLWLADCQLTDESVAALCNARLPALKGLWLHGNQLTDAGVERLVKAALLSQLEGLSLFHNALGEKSGSLLAGHPLAGARQGTARLEGVGAMWFARG